MPKHHFEKRLLARLVRMESITDLQAAQARELARGRAIPVARALVLLGFASEVRVQKVVARLSGLEFIDLENFTPRPDALESIDGATARRYQAVPLGIVERALVVAVSDPEDLLALDDLKAIANAPVRAVLATESALKSALDRHYAHAAGASSDRVRKLDFREIMGGASEVLDESLDDPDVPGEPDDPEVGTDERAATRSDVHSLETLLESTASALPARARPPSRDSISEMPTVLEDAPPPERALPAGNAPPPEHATPATADPAEYYPGPATEAIDVLLPGHEPGRDTRDETSEKSVLAVLKALLDEALAARAEELALAPPDDRRCQPRLRRQGEWSNGTPYAQRYHEPVIAKLRELAGAQGPHGVGEHRFVLEGRAGQIAAAAFFSATQRGARCVLRFPENVPLLQRPLRALGLPRDLEQRLDARLSGGGGLLLLTTPRARTSDQLYASLLLDQASRGRSVASVSWSIDRNLPGVAQTRGGTEQEVLAALRAAAAEGPDLLGLAAAPTAVVLRECAAIAARGQAVVAVLSAPDAAVGAALLGAAGLDPMALLRDVAAHIHAVAIRRLHPAHRRVLRCAPGELPLWAEDIPADKLMESDGGAGAPHPGFAWAAEASVPAPNAPNGLEPVQRLEDALRKLAADGLVDPRSAP